MRASPALAVQHCGAGAGKDWCGGTRPALPCHGVPGLRGAGRREALQPVMVSRLGVVMLCSPEDTEGHQNGAKVLCKGKAKCQLASPAASRNA